MKSKRLCEVAHCTYRADTACTVGPFPDMQVRAQTAAPGSSVLGKLARVFKEKAAQDLDRIRKGTSKTREKLGVRAGGGWGSWGGRAATLVESRPAGCKSYPCEFVPICPPGD